MRYSVGEQLTFKKNHACGSNIWEVIKLGAEIKLECQGCKRHISLLPSEIDRRKKTKKIKCNKMVAIYLQILYNI